MFPIVFVCFCCCYFLSRLIYCQRSEIVRPPYIVFFFQQYELSLVDEHIIILCIFILSQIRFCLNQVIELALSCVSHRFKRFYPAASPTLLLLQGTRRPSYHCSVTRHPAYRCSVTRHPAYCCSVTRHPSYRCSVTCHPFYCCSVTRHTAYRRSVTRHPSYCCPK